MLRSTRDVVVIGGSAGGLEAAIEVLATLPVGFPVAAFLALHHRSDARTLREIARILHQRIALSVKAARDKTPVEPGVVYVAPSDRHLLLENGIVRVERSPRENQFRPCINVLFKSAAATYGRRVVGVLLSGVGGNDGAAGLWHIRQRGGVTIVQDPADARFPGMPEAALADVAVHHVLPVARIGAKLVELVDSAGAGAPAESARILIVEDESVVATNLQQSLAEMGYEVIDWVPTGEAAVEIAERERPDLILMDIHLAGALRGVDAARRIWERLQIPIVYCTAHADLATLKEVQTTESYGYVVKPFQSPAVRAAIELAMARREKESR